MADAPTRKHRAGTCEDFSYCRNGWPEKRWTAEVDGKTLMQKGGERPRKFRSKHAAMIVARAECDRLEQLH